MNKPHIKKGDQVLVLTGKDKGRQGKVLDVLPKKSRAVVDGINVVKKAQKPDPQKNTPGGHVERSMPIHLSNLMLIDPQTGKPGRVGYKVDKNTGEKVRYVKPSKRKVTR